MTDQHPLNPDATDALIAEGRRDMEADAAYWGGKHPAARALRLQAALARLGHPIPDGVALRVAEEMGE